MVKIRFIEMICRVQCSEMCCEYSSEVPQPLLSGALGNPAPFSFCLCTMQLTAFSTCCSRSWGSAELLHEPPSVPALPAALQRLLQLHPAPSTHSCHLSLAPLEEVALPSSCYTRGLWLWWLHKALFHFRAAERRCTCGSVWQTTPEGVCKRQTMLPRISLHTLLHCLVLPGKDAPQAATP